MISSDGPVHGLGGPFSGPLNEHVLGGNGAQNDAGDAEDEELTRADGQITGKHVSGIGWEQLFSLWCPRWVVWQVHVQDIPGFQDGDDVTNP